MKIFISCVILTANISFLTLNAQAWQPGTERTLKKFTSLMCFQGKNALIPSLLQKTGLELTQKRESSTQPLNASLKEIQSLASVYASPVQHNVLRYVIRDSKLRSSFLRSFLPEKEIFLSVYPHHNPAICTKSDLKPVESFSNPKFIKEIANTLDSADCCISRVSDENGKSSLTRDEDSTVFLHALKDHILANKNPSSLTYFLNNNEKKIMMVIEKLSSSNYCVARRITEEDNHSSFILAPKMTKFFYSLVDHFEEKISSSTEHFYTPKSMYFCEARTPAFMVAIQASHAAYWDLQNIAEVTRLSNISEVFIINILGGNRQIPNIWVSENNPFNMKNSSINIIQRSVLNSLLPENQAQRDWKTFFREAHFMTEKEVRERIKTPAVQQAFDKVQLDKLPSHVVKPRLSN